MSGRAFLQETLGIQWLADAILTRVLAHLHKKLFCILLDQIHEVIRVEAKRKARDLEFRDDIKNPVLRVATSR